MKYMLGVDGGGTRTRAVVIDEFANVQGLGYSGSSNYDDVGAQQAQWHLHAAIRQACAPISGPGRLSAAYLGIAGVVVNRDRLLVREMLQGLGLADDASVTIDHDCGTALAGAIGEGPGVVVIAGTGSSCYGRNESGETWLCGGWGYLLDDLGSSYFLG
jgi:N-acetylglucosamine kinase-like BadF-type ATPase